MPKFISFDMDGTLIASDYTDWVWGHGIPTLYAEKTGLPFEEAKALVEEEYRKVGEGAIEWYDIKYWFQFFQLGIECRYDNRSDSCQMGRSWKALMEQFVDKIRVYPDVDPILDRLKGRFPLVLTTNAGREFIDVEMKATGLRKYFDRIFSATTDFGEVKKTARFYRRICQVLRTDPAEMIHVGDHYEFDYLVPRRLGIRAFYLDRSGQQKGDFVIRDLGDLENRLLKM